MLAVYTYKCVVPSAVVQSWHRINVAFLPVAVIKKFIVSGFKNKCFFFLVLLEPEMQNETRGAQIKVLVGLVSSDHSQEVCSLSFATSDG